MRVRRLSSRARSATTAALACSTLLLTACVADLPASVIEGSTITVGWSQSLTSLNASTSAGATTGNREVAAVTRDSFARVAGGEVVEDASFGEAKVIDSDPAAFTVRYDLAERTWSDGIPIDAADLLLAWAAGSNATAGAFDSIPGDLRRSAEMPTVDDFERRIDVSFTEPVRGWHTALDVAVPAHVVGEMALGVEDPMEAKQAVIDAITDDDEGDLAEIAETWSSGFDLGSADGDLPDRLSVGSGPYLVTAVDGGESGAGGLTLEVNRGYKGDNPPSYERIEVVPEGDPLAAFPEDLDVVQVHPTPENFVAVRDLKRRDHNATESHDGRLWVLALRADDGVFRSVGARRAFLRATSTSDVRSAGAGAWGGAFIATQSLLFAPESAGYDIALEDAGFREAFDAASTEAAEERAAAGVPGGTRVCVLYDNDDPFAAGAFPGLVASVADAGWAVTDCGAPDIEAPLAAGRGWQAVLTTVPLPETPYEISAVWGGAEKSPITGLRNKARRLLVEQLGTTADVYDARALQVAIETGLIKQAVAVPLTLDPVVTLAERRLSAILPASGESATLLGDAGNWGPHR